MGRRINTVMQTCFFAISGILPQDQAIAAIKRAVEKTYGRKGRRIAEQNYRAIDATMAALQRVDVPATLAAATDGAAPIVAAGLDAFTRRVTIPLIQGKGDALPVSLLPVDGTWPTGTARHEKRNIALEIPVWDEKLCTQCGKCVFVCPHSAIRAKVFPAERVADAPIAFKHVPARSKDYAPGTHMSYQVAPEDCTGCTLCVDVCPIRDKSNVSHKALNMAPQPPLRAQEAENWDYFLKLPRPRPPRRQAHHHPRLHAAAAAVRVLRRLRGLRRDALHPAWPPSSSATACWWPTPPAARRSTAATCRPRPTPPTPTAAARRGTTRCSRTTPNSASACASPPTSSARRRAYPVAGAGGHARRAAR